MKSLILISFNLANSSTHYDEVISNIKRQGTWARITPNTWCVKNSNFSAGDIRDEISHLFGADDRLFVVDITNSEWASYYLPREVAQWLKE